MIQRVDRRELSKLPKGNIVDGVALCPKCWRPLCEPLSGEGVMAVWCRQCRENRIVKFNVKA